MSSFVFRLFSRSIEVWNICWIGYTKYKLLASGMILYRDYVPKPSQVLDPYEECVDRGPSIQRIWSRHISFDTYVTDEAPLLSVRIYLKKHTRCELFFHVVNEATLEVGAVTEIHHCKPSQIDVASVRWIRRTRDSPESSEPGQRIHIGETVLQVQGRLTEAGHDGDTGLCGRCETIFAQRRVASFSLYL